MCALKVWLVNLSTRNPHCGSDQEKKKKETVQQRKVVHEENEIKGLEQGMTKERTDA